MIHPETAKLIEEVFGFFDTHGFSTGHKNADLAKKTPETCIVSLLRKIKEELPEGPGGLRLIVEMAIFEDSVKKARELLSADVKMSPSHVPKKRTGTRRTKGSSGPAKLVAEPI